MQHVLIIAAVSVLGCAFATLASALHASLFWLLPTAWLLVISIGLLWQARSIEVRR